MNRIYTSLALLLTVIAWSIPHTTSAASEEAAKQIEAIATYINNTFTTRTYAPLDNNTTRDIINGGVDWIITSQESSGHFQYEYAPYENTYSDDDNIVRQAGTLYSLGEVAVKSTEPNTKLQYAMQRSITFFENNSKDDTFNEHSFSCITNGSSSNKCILGATSLALLGVLDYAEAYPEEADTYADLIEAYTNYIVAMKIPQAGFQNIYYVESQKSSTEESSFSNGEAMLALVRSYKHTPRPEVKEILDESFVYLSELPFESPLYLWIMAALKDMHVLWPNPAYTTYGKTFTDWRMDRTVRQKHTDRNFCAVTEGVASAYTLLEDVLTDTEKQTLRTEIDFWNSKNSTYQISPNDTYRVIWSDKTLTLQKITDIDTALGGFLTGDNDLTQRIDFTQHCVSTYLQTLVDIDKQPFTYD